MKANAPERIWIEPATDLTKLSGHVDNDSVEYIRKDAFIEKALKYLDVNFYFNNSRYSIECRVFDSKEEMLKDFKKYMED